MGIEISKSGRKRLRDVWAAMMERCYDPAFKEYMHYGGSGVTVCDEWRYSFPAFLMWAMENGYDENAGRKDCTLDRIDPFGDYSPDNCRWVDMTTQNSNQKVNVIHDSNEDFLYKNEVAELLGKSVSFVETRTASGVIPSMLIGGRRLYSKIIIEAMRPAILASKTPRSSKVVGQKYKTGQGSDNYRPWTEAEEQIILHPDGKTIDEIAAEIGRSKHCVYARLRRLGTNWKSVKMSG